MLDPKPDALRREIANAEARLAELDAERAATVRRLDELGRRLATAETPNAQLPVLDPGRRPRSKREKLALFRSLFAGRTDVFPRFWHNTRTKAQGYAPACGTTLGLEGPDGSRGMVA